MATGRVNDAFIIVDTNGVAGVPVLFENRRIGATNRRGRLLVPGVTAYHTARVSIDPLHLPLDVQAAVTEQHVAVERHAGTVVSFPLRRTVSATIRLVDAEGAPLPVGARVVHQQSGSTFVTGWTGLVYIDHVTSENTLTVTREDGRTCTVSFASLDLPLRYGAVSRQTCR
jgi:outer membrane usher protein